VRFGKPFLGSLAVVGGIDGDTLVQTDSDGLSVAEVVQRFGLNPGEFATAALDPATFGYVEFHIEQGPLLDNERQPVAVVDAIAGQTRIQFTFAGHANHAGTTPMGPLRHDALAAAAEWISEVEAYGIRTHGLVATVGKLDIPASATNVVPGRCVASLDVRHACDPVRAMAVRHLIEFAQKAAQWRGVTVTYASQNDQPAVSMDTAITDLLDRAVTRITGKPARHMVSGAGHDAMILARKVPSAMLFLRSPGGISHHPEESVLAEDVEVALNTGVDLLRTLRDDTALLSQLVAGAKGRKYDGMHA
jgi:allantoate deiminase